MAHIKKKKALQEERGEWTVAFIFNLSIVKIN